MRVAAVLVISPLVAPALASAASAQQPPAQVTVTVQQPGQPAQAQQGQLLQPNAQQAVQPPPGQATPSPPSAQTIGAPGVPPQPNQAR